MTKIYYTVRKSAMLSIANDPVRQLVNKYVSATTKEKFRLRVIVSDNDYKNPLVQLARYEYDDYEPWKSDYWMCEEVHWDGLFVPDESWLLNVLPEYPETSVRMMS